jgi:hypothetical protein
MTRLVSFFLIVAVSLVIAQQIGTQTGARVATLFATINHAVENVGR